MRIIVDAFGGDNAPLEIIKGCELAVKAHDVDILLVGKEETIRKVAAENKISLDRMEILDAPDVIAMEDHPNLIRTEMKNCSLAVAMRALAEGKGDGFVGAGYIPARLVQKNDNNVESYIEKNEKTINKRYDQIIEYFTTYKDTH